MRCVPFDEANRALTAPRNHVPDQEIGNIESLPVWTNGRQCISCWRMSWRERLSALFFGRTWLAVASGETQPPVYVQTSRTYFERKDAA